MIAFDQGGRAGAAARYFTLPPGLRLLAEHGFALRYPEPDRSWRIVPDPSPHLLARWRRDGAGRAALDRVSLIGPRRRFVDVNVSERAWTVGLRLAPGVLPALVDDAAGEWADRGFDAGTVWGWRGRRLEDRLLTSPAPAAAVATLARFAGDAIARSGFGTDDLAWLAVIRDLPVNARPARLALALGIGGRALRRLMAETIGLSAARFLRIHRLFRALRLGLGGVPGGWTEVAHRAGYADQPHMNRDFRELLGASPAAYRARGRGAVSSKRGDRPGC